jgi:hypothetical protein
MSLYNIQNYINNIPMVLGQTKEEQTLSTNKIDSNKELIKRAKELGLKVPKYY